MKLHAWLDAHGLEPLRKHLPGGHDQLAHGRRGGKPGKGETRRAQIERGRAEYQRALARITPERKAKGEAKIAAMWAGAKKSPNPVAETTPNRRTIHHMTDTASATEAKPARRNDVREVSSDGWTVKVRDTNKATHFEITHPDGHVFTRRSEGLGRDYTHAVTRADADGNHRIIGMSRSLDAARNAGKQQYGAGRFGMLDLATGKHTETGTVEARQPASAAKQSRMEAAQARAEKAAAKAIANPDGSPLTDWTGHKVSTVSEARQRMTSLAWYTHPKYDAGEDRGDVTARMNEEFDRVAAALAHKTGDDADEIKAKARKKADAEWRRVERKRSAEV